MLLLKDKNGGLVFGPDPSTIEFALREDGKGLVVSNGFSRLFSSIYRVPTDNHLFYSFANSSLIF